MTRKTLITLAVLAAFSAGSAMAAVQASDTATRASRVALDANGDGFVDRAEAAGKPRLAQRFAQLDRNADGRLSKEEMPARGSHGKHGGGRAMMEQVDTDKDSRISRAEANAAGGKLAENFARMDVNKDGYIDAADRQQRARERADAWFEAADTDGNGQISRAEYDAAQAKRMREGAGRAWGGKPAAR